MLKRALLLALALSPALYSSAVAATPAYVSNDVFIYLHSGPSRQYRIIGTINAGEPVDLMQSGDKFSQVKDSSGREGWVQSQFLTDQATFRVTLPKLQSQLKDAEDKLSQLAGNRSDLNRQLQSLADEKAKLSAQVADQQATITQLKAQVAGMDQSNMMLWLMYGGGVAGGGLLLGLLLPHIVPRRKRKDMWM